MFCPVSWCTGCAGVYHSSVLLSNSSPVLPRLCGTAPISLSPLLELYIIIIHVHVLSVPEQRVKSAGIYSMAGHFPLHLLLWFCSMMLWKSCIEIDPLDIVQQCVCTASRQHLQLYICEFLSPFPISQDSFLSLHIINFDDSLCWHESTTGIFVLLFTLSEHTLKYFLLRYVRSAFLRSSRIASFSFCAPATIVTAGCAFAFC